MEFSGNGLHTSGIWNGQVLICVGRNHFENRAFWTRWHHDNCVNSMTMFSSNANPTWPVIVTFSNSWSVVGWKTFWIFFSEWNVQFSCSQWYRQDLWSVGQWLINRFVRSDYNVRDDACFFFQCKPSELESDWWITVEFKERLQKGQAYTVSTESKRFQSTLWTVRTINGLFMFFVFAMFLVFPCVVFFPLYMCQQPSWITPDQSVHQFLFSKQGRERHFIVYYKCMLYVLIIC